MAQLGSDGADVVITSGNADIFDRETRVILDLRGLVLNGEIRLRSIPSRGERELGGSPWRNQSSIANLGSWPMDIR